MQQDQETGGLEAELSPSVPQPEAGPVVAVAEALGEFADYETHEGDDEPTPLPPKQRAEAAMRLMAKVEAIVFAAQNPIKAQDIVDILADPEVALDHVEASLRQLELDYADRAGGFRLVYLRRLGYQFQTVDAAGPIMERMFASRPRPISRAALETLAIIAYRQPVTRAEVEFIRGVDAGSIFKTLLERDLIKCVGRKEMIGRPMLFGTTDQFLTVFNLSSIKDLPPLSAFQPSREVVDGAGERLAAGVEAELVDVEEYIADNTPTELADSAPAELADHAPTAIVEGSPTPTESGQQEAHDETSI